MTENTLTFLARRYLERATSEQAIDWALSELIAGTDSRSLCILAGLETPANVFEVDSLVRRSFDELSWQFPDEHECLGKYARLTAQSILAGTTTPLDGCNELYHIYVALGAPSDLQAWLYLDEGLEFRTYRSLEGPQLEAAIRREASILLGRHCDPE